MNRICLLSDELISQIAAGEVIERPASCVKELVENSLDAGATQISVEVDEGGLEKIRVVDDGHGMSHEDAALAFARHATSKIADLEDLFQIRTLGFRGEALASIASIAHVTLKTRRAEDRVGSQVELDGGKGREGKLGCAEWCTCETGTEIVVRGLFSHTPARKKYMKSERTEYGHIFDLLVMIALSHPEVGLRLMRDGEKIFDLVPKQNLKERVRTLFGGSVADALIPLTYQQSNLMISGFIGKPELARSGKKYQFLFVNGRAVEDRLLSHAVKEAFHSLLMHEKFPWFLLDITLDPALVDVNVHPRKWQVKFVNTQEMYRAVFGAAHHALEKNSLSPVLETHTVLETLSPETFQTGAVSASSSPSQLSALFDREMSPQRSFAHAMELKGSASLRPLAQVANSYIVAESEEGLVLIDQHAAHERVRYAKLMKALETKKSVQQLLLTPLELDLGVEGARLVGDYAEDFVALGYNLEHFGGTTYLLRAVPVGLEKKEPERVVREIVSSLSDERKSNAVKNLQESLLTMTACRGAIKFGDDLTLFEMEALLREMESTPNADHCPHGRPSIISFTFEDLESRFKRRNF